MLYDKRSYMMDRIYNCLSNIKLFLLIDISFDKWRY